MNDQVRHAHTEDTMYGTDAYPELIYAAAQERVHRLERDRVAHEARREHARRRRARLLARCRIAGR